MSDAIMTKERAAGLLNGSEYGKEGTPAPWAQMEAAGLVAVYGASDDLMEFNGAIYDEFGAYDGGDAYVTPDGRATSDEMMDGIRIAAIWGDEDGPVWTYETEIPHVTFDVMEDGETYCRGIVFALADVPTVVVPVPVPAAVSECLGFFASVIKSGEPWTPTCEEMYAKAKAAMS